MNGFRAIAAFALLLTVAGAGCVGTGYRPYPLAEPCPKAETARVEAVVENAPGALVEVALVERAALRAQSCPPAHPPPPRLGPTGEGTAEGDVSPRAYDEVRVRTAEGILRLAADFTAAANGTLHLDFGPTPPVARWNGTPLDVRAHERFDDPRALDGFSVRWLDETPEETVRRAAFRVNSSWNHGARAEVGITFGGEDRAIAQDVERSAGARVELRLLDAEGRVVAWRNATRIFEPVSLLIGPLAVGLYAVEMRATPADDDAFPVGHRVELSFAY